MPVGSVYLGGVDYGCSEDVGVGGFGVRRGVGQVIASDDEWRFWVLGFDVVGCIARETVFRLVVASLLVADGCVVWIRAGGCCVGGVLVDKVAVLVGMS